jgi:lipopolysaccharide export system permease protein
MSAMHRKNEIIAMKAAGVSLFSITLPLLVVGLLSAGFIWYLIGSLIPLASTKLEAFRSEIALRGVEEGRRATFRKHRSYENLGLMQLRENRLWLMEVYHPLQFRGERVSVFEVDPSTGGERYRILANEATFRPETGDWVFHNGEELYYDGLTEEPYRKVRFERLEKPHYRDSPELMVVLRLKPRHLSFVELKEVLAFYEGSESEEVMPYQVRFYRILLSPLVCVLVVLFGVPFAVGGVRINPMIGISKAFGMFLVFFAVSSVSGLLGDSGHLPPLVASCVPLGLVGLLAGRVFVRAL